MLARRIIPCLDVAGGRVVKGVHFEALRDAGDPVEQAARYDAEGADELVVLDISASPDDRRTTLDMGARVRDMSRTSFSKLPGRKLYQEMTVRNTNTTRKLYELMKEIGSHA